jgi:hypothetical protein
MRHSGIPRRNKPFIGAADLHFPLIDTALDKFKPFYLNAAFGTQQLASFTPLSAAKSEASASAEQCFDWKTRNETNFESELDMVFDSMLMGGRAILKQRWVSGEKTVEYEYIDPLFLIVPKSTRDLKTASWVCHVKQLSFLDYELDEAYAGKQDPEFIAKIRGGKERQLDTAGRDQEKALREGITYSDDDDTIVLFEVWAREKAGWRVHTFAPGLPDDPVRAPFLCPYKSQGKPYLPFVSYQFEVKDRGWYAPRGVAERLAPFETYLSKTWNAKADAMEFHSKPLFTSDQPLTNTGNVKFRPGDWMPPGTRAVELPPPSISLDNEMNLTRTIAQEAIQVPDFGASEEGKPTKTATEVSYVQSFASQGVQYRGRIAFRSLAETFRISWALWVQYGGEELAFIAAQDRQVLPAQARVDNYHIEPNGTPDQWNRGQRLQRAIARFNMFRAHPNIDQAELAKSILEEDDPRLVKRLFVDSGQRSANEQEDEAIEIMLCMSGYPPSVRPGEDHALRIRMIAGKLAQLAHTGAPVDPVAQQRLHDHLVAHLQALQQENPALAKQFTSAIHALDGGETAPPAPVNSVPGPAAAEPEFQSAAGPGPGAGPGVPGMEMAGAV